MEKLSTGLRINSAADDAAGLQISNRMQTQRNGLDVAIRNANDAISMSQTAEGAMAEHTDILNRMRDLALQSANDTNSERDRAAMQKEVDALILEVDRISETTSFAGRNLLDGSAQGLTFQVGANANETISLTIADLSSTALKGNLNEVVLTDAAGVTAVLEKLNGTPNTTPTANDKVAGVNVAMTVGSVSMVIETTDVDALGTGNMTAEGLVAEMNKNMQAGKAEGAVSLTDAGEILFSADDIDVEIINAGTVVKTAAVEVSVDKIDLTSAASSQKAVQILDGALATVDDYRADLGAVPEPSGIHYRQPVQR